MSTIAYDREYPSDWKNVLVKTRESYDSPVADFHEHAYYEINLILSGNVNILLKSQVDDGTQCRLVLTKPHTPHFVTCKSDVLYSRLYLLFTEAFLADCPPEWRELQTLFGEHGRVIPLTPEQRDFCKHHILRIESENHPLRQKLLILYLLSYISEFTASAQPHIATPTYILNALGYIEQHYAEKITADALARQMFVGRTTLMTAFKRYTGSTISDYVTQCRLKNAIELLERGHTEQAAAEACGLGDSSGLIRCFKRTFGVTPRQYVPKTNRENN